MSFFSHAVQHFSFVLTNIDSQWTFGFCRQASNSSTCYVILRYLVSYKPNFIEKYYLIIFIILFQIWKFLYPVLISTFDKCLL